MGGFSDLLNTRPSSLLILLGWSSVSVACMMIWSIYSDLVKMTLIVPNLLIFFKYSCSAVNGISVVALKIASHGEIYNPLALNDAYAALHGVKNSLQCSICISQLWPFLYSPVGDFFLP
jgi:hypothetical protein